MSQLEECREALRRQIEITAFEQAKATALRAALREACGGDIVAAGMLYQKHEERLEMLRDKVKP